MSNHTPILPDPLPLREALRGLRHVLRRGGHSLAETLAVETLPQPAAKVAVKVLREAEDLARNVDTAASGLARPMLGGDAGEPVHLTHLQADGDLSGPFAHSVYAALNSVIPRLGAKAAFVSEIAARESYLACAARAHDDAADLAADLMASLLGARVLRDLQQGASRLPEGALEPVAVFAVLLWQQSSWSEADSEAALDAAVDIAIAVQADCLAALQSGDVSRVAALFRKYAAHV